MSLRLRLALVFALGTAVLIVVASLTFMSQLSSSLNAALDSGLRSRAATVGTQLDSHTLPSQQGALPSAQAGNQTGQWPRPGVDEFTQIVTLGGAVIYGPGGTDPLLSRAQLLSANKRGNMTLTTTLEGEPVRLLATRVHQAGLVTVVGVKTDVADAARDRARNVALIGGPVAVLVAGLGAWLLTGAALRPVDRLRRRLEDITEHDRGSQLEVPATGDELAALAITMNRLLGRLQLALARQRSFVADAGHELRTPLTALKAELQLAARPGKPKAELVAGVKAAAGDTDRLIRLAEDLLLLARADEGSGFLNVAHVEVADVISAAARGLAPSAAEHDVAIAVQTDHELIALADPDQIRQVLDNVIGNAIKHSPPGSTVDVTGRLQAANGHQHVAVEVRDHGSGFPPDFLPVAFERFRRADAARGRADGGAGLGLAIVAAIARAHGGSVTAANHPNGGAVVGLELPVNGPADG
ncbi:MAG TPA: ATP-binding protein [Streptosporangiaceae bacterium]|nr:ATP-binding protein [Streptosporangiaceae bacterium]